MQAQQTDLSLVTACRRSQSVLGVFWREIHLTFFGKDIGLIVLADASRVETRCQNSNI